VCVCVCVLECACACANVIVVGRVSPSAKKEKERKKKKRTILAPHTDLIERLTDVISIRFAATSTTESSTNATSARLPRNLLRNPGKMPTHWNSRVDRSSPPGVTSRFTVSTLDTCGVAGFGYLSHEAYDTRSHGWLRGPAKAVPEIQTQIRQHESFSIQSGQNHRGVCVWGGSGAGTKKKKKKKKEEKKKTPKEIAKPKHLRGASLSNAILILFHLSPPHHDPPSNDEFNNCTLIMQQT
jgi:hypothetical protein